MPALYYSVLPLSDKFFDSNTPYQSIIEFIAPEEDPSQLIDLFLKEHNIRHDVSGTFFDEAYELVNVKKAVFTDKKVTGDFIYKTSYKLSDHDGQNSGILHEKGYILRNEKLLYAITEFFPTNNLCLLDNSQKHYISSKFAEILSKKKLLGKNVNFRIGSKPIYLREDDCDLIKQIINRDIEYCLPVVIVRNEEINARELASKLGMMATVLVDKDSDIFETLQNDSTVTDKTRIPKEDCVTIYFPNEAKKYASISEQGSNENINVYMDTIVQAISNYMMQQYNPNFEKYSYDVGKFNLITELYEFSQRELAKQRSKNDQYHQQLKDTIKDNKLRNYKNSLIPTSSNKTANISNTNKTLLRYGSEKNLYDGEIKDMVLSSLANYRKQSVKDGSRRADVLDDIISNNDYQKICESKKDGIKKIFDGYDSIKPTTINQLEKIGFKVKSHNNHLKLIWYNDERYTETVSSTPSDTNAGKSAIRQLNSKLL